MCTRTPTHFASTGTLRRGVTLVETIASIVVIGIVAAVITPVVASAGTHYAKTVAARRGVDRLAFALERCDQFLRQIPAGATSGTLAIASASSDSVRLLDGRGLELGGGQTLLLRATDGTTSPILTGVTTFEITCIGADGISLTNSTPTASHTFRVRIVAGGAELRTVVFARLAGTP